MKKAYFKRQFNVVEMCNCSFLLNCSLGYVNLL